MDSEQLLLRDGLNVTSTRFGGGGKVIVFLSVYPLPFSQKTASQQVLF